MVQLSQLKYADYNARQMGADEERGIKKSLAEFGVVDPIIINSFEGRENVIIGGHQRVIVLKKMHPSTFEVPCVVLKLDPEKEKELNLRLNKNVGSWDWRKLIAEYEKNLLQEVGFTDKELAEHADLDSLAGTQGKEEFSEELLLEHNYVVLYFDNPLDWQVAQEKLGLKEVKDLIPRKGQSTGIGRVIKGKDVIAKL